VQCALKRFIKYIFYTECHAHGIRQGIATTEIKMAICVMPRTWHSTRQIATTEIKMAIRVTEGHPFGSLLHVTSNAIDESLMEGMPRLWHSDQWHASSSNPHGILERRMPELWHS
jgi:hypothetical protein